MAPTTPLTANATQGGRPITSVAAALLLGLFWWLAVSASTRWSQTSDELPHVTAGYVYDKFGDYRMHSENGNLPQRVHGLAPLALGAQFPMDPERWRNSDYWQLGWDFFYAANNPTDRMLLGARALNALFGVALGWFIFAVARRWHGDAGGLLALGFYVLCPNFLAHSALATSDLAGALGLTLAPWLFWQHLEKRRAASGVIAGLAGGLALVAKFNGLLLAPIYALLIVVDAVCRAERGARLRRLGWNLLLGAAQAGVAVLVIWACFGFRFAINSPTAPALEKLAWSWPQMLSLIGWKAAVIEFAAEHRLLPYGWLYGFANVLAGGAARPAFLAGQYSLTGWREFFPVMFLTKTPLAFLLALGIAGGLQLVRWLGQTWEARRAQGLRWTPLAVTAAVVLGTALTSNLNIGHRHILPLYPALFIAAGGLAPAGRRLLLLAAALLAG